jgi:hypothetical protein
MIWKVTDEALREMRAVNIVQINMTPSGYAPINKKSPRNMRNNADCIVRYAWKGQAGSDTHARNL